MYESLHSRHEEISRPQASSQTISPREKWRQRPSQRLVLRCSPWNCPRSACSCHISQLQGLFQCFIPVMMMKTNAPVCFTARCPCTSPCPVPNAISSFSPEQLGKVQAIYFLWFAFEFSIFFLSRNVYLRWTFLLQLLYEELPLGQLSQTCLRKGDYFSCSLPSLPQTSMYGLYQSWGTALGRHLFWYYITFPKILFVFPLLQLPFPKPGLTSSLHLACMALFLTSLNIALASEDPICTVYNILCMQLGKQELCEHRPSLSLTGFIKFNREQHKCGWVVWPLHKISHRCSTSLLFQF